MWHLHSYPVLTILDRAGSGVASLFWPARSIWLVPLLTGNATVDKDGRYQRTAKHTNTHTHTYVCLETHCCQCVCATYPSSKDLVDGSALFQSALCHYFGSHLLHIQHESIQRFLDVRPLVLFFLGRNRGFPANPKHKDDAVNKIKSRCEIKAHVCEILCFVQVKDCFKCSYACMEGLMLSPLGSCLIAGETMAGWGMPVWWRLCGGGVTMWGEKRLDTKLNERKTYFNLTVRFDRELSVNLTRKGWANLAQECPALPSGWNSLCLTTSVWIHTHNEWNACFFLFK